MAWTRRVVGFTGLPDHKPDLTPVLGRIVAGELRVGVPGDGKIAGALRGDAGLRLVLAHRAIKDRTVLKPTADLFQCGFNPAVENLLTLLRSKVEVSVADRCSALECGRGASDHSAAA